MLQYDELANQPAQHLNISYHEREQRYGTQVHLVLSGVGEHTHPVTEAPNYQQMLDQGPPPGPPPPKGKGKGRNRRRIASTGTMAALLSPFLIGMTFTIIKFLFYDNCDDNACGSLRTSRIAVFSQLFLQTLRR